MCTIATIISIIFILSLFIALGGYLLAKNEPKDLTPEEFDEWHEERKIAEWKKVNNDFEDK